MTAKEYCEYSLKLRKEIGIKENLVMTLKDIAEKETSSLNAVSVQSSSSKRGMADTVEAFTDMQDRLEKDKAQLKKMLLVIGTGIMNLEDPGQIEVLRVFYIDGLNGTRAIKKLRMTNTTVYKLRMEGLNRLKLEGDPLLLGKL